MHVLRQVPDEKPAQKSAQHRAGHIHRHHARHVAATELLANVGQDHHRDPRHCQPLQKPQHQHGVNVAHPEDRHGGQSQEQHRPHDQRLAPPRVRDHAHERSRECHRQHRHPHRIADLHHRGMEILQQDRQNGLHRIHMQEGKGPDQRACDQQHRTRDAFGFERGDGGRGGGGCGSGRQRGSGRGVHGKGRGSRVLPHAAAGEEGRTSLADGPCSGNNFLSPLGEGKVCVWQMFSGKPRKPSCQRSVNIAYCAPFA